MNGGFLGSLRSAGAKEAIDQSLESWALGAWKSRLPAICSPRDFVLYIGNGRWRKPAEGRMLGGMKKMRWRSCFSGTGRPPLSRSTARCRARRIRGSTPRLLVASLTWMLLVTTSACRHDEPATGERAADVASTGAAESTVQSEAAAPTDSERASHGPESLAPNPTGGWISSQARVELGSGIEGLAVIGPVCPTVEESRPCPDRPYQAELTVRHADSGDVAAVVVSDTEGRFRIDVPPGSYIVDPGVPRLVSEPRAEPVKVDVEADRYAQVVIRFDSGVR